MIKYIICFPVTHYFGITQYSIGKQITKMPHCSAFSDSLKLIWQVSIYATSSHIIIHIENKTGNEE